VLAAFRRLGMDHILSSPGTEWAPVWEAMARQTSSWGSRSQAAQSNNFNR
jgi:hypothetical protein